MATRTQSCVEVLIHVVWATKHRAPLLPASYEALLHQRLRTIAASAATEVLGVGSADDHVHVLVRLPAVKALAKLVQSLKGVSAFQANDRGDVPHELHWQDGYWAESFSPAAIPSLRSYLREQRERHLRNIREPWEDALAITREPAKRA